MSWSFKNWYRHRVLENGSVPDDLWREAVARLRSLRGLTPIELKRLRECVILFLHAKQISGTHELIITGEMHVMIAAQACILILNLDLDWYDGWVEIIVYPGEFLRDYEYVDENGVAHRARESVSGESWVRGPVILSWKDAANADTSIGYNVVIHEFAHKLDMLNGDANGFPPLHADMSKQEWSDVFGEAYAIFCLSVDTDEATVIDPYAAENPAEFFAVMSEAFFEMPLVVKLNFPAVYGQLVLFYRQDSARRWDKS